MFLIQHIRYLPTYTILAYINGSTKYLNIWLNVLLTAYASLIPITFLLRMHLSTRLIIWLYRWYLQPLNAAWHPLATANGIKNDMEGLIKHKIVSRIRIEVHYWVRNSSLIHRITNLCVDTISRRHTHMSRCVTCDDRLVKSAVLRRMKSRRSYFALLLARN